MNTFISMLRGINVSGQKKIRMLELRDLYESLDLTHVETYIQSGNVVFDSIEPDSSKIAELIESKIINTFGYAVPVIIRNTHDFKRIINSNPFLIERNEDPSKLAVTFLKRIPAKSKLSELAVPNNETAEFVKGNGEIYLFYPNGFGRTKLTNTFIERKLGIPATSRNWKTINALYILAIER